MMLTSRSYSTYKDLYSHRTMYRTLSTVSLGLLTRYLTATKTPGKANFLSL